MSASGPTTNRTISSVLQEACARLYKKSGAERYGLTADQFSAILISISDQYAPKATEGDSIRLLESLKVEELALARGCAAGNEQAWEIFLNRYRSSLYAAAHAIAKEESAARELADSIYAELYGLPSQSGRRVSKLEYYKGRGSLEGWLRTVLAQEFVNRHRKTKHETSLEEKVEAGAQFAAPVATTEPTAAPIELAIGTCLKRLDADDRLLLAMYFLDGRTLAEIGRLINVHESTISRKLDRLTDGLRRAIRKELIAQGLSSRQADEAMQDLDVRDLNVNVRKNLEQENGSATFYKSEENKQA